jgi:uncharacterized membrane protein
MTAQPFRARPWPADRWPTPSELLEFARVTTTDQVTPVLQTMIEAGQRGQHCLVMNHDAAITDLHLQAAELGAQLERARLAHREARQRAIHWRRIAVELATTTDPNRALELAAGAVSLDAGFSIDKPPAPVLTVVDALEAE